MDEKWNYILGYLVWIVISTIWSMIKDDTKNEVIGRYCFTFIITTIIFLFIESTFIFIESDM